MDDEGWSQEQAQNHAPSHFELVKKMAERFMGLANDTSPPSPMDFILRLRAYGLKIRYNVTEDGVIDWVGDKVLYGHTSFSMAELRSTVHGLVEATRGELHKKLLLLDVNGEEILTAEGLAQLPPIPWAGLVDNPAEMSVGWNLFRDGRNQFTVDGRSWLYTRILKEPRLQKAFIRRTQMQEPEPARQQQQGQQRSWEWSAARLRKYRRELRTFREHLLVLVHMTGGQPGRATELLSIQHKNSINGTIRGVFVEDGLMAVVTGYHKGFGLSGKMKIVHRYLPREVGELLFYYLWLVEPFWQTMKVVCGGAREEASPFLWEPKKEPRWSMPPQKQKRKRKHLHDEEGEGRRKRRTSGRASAVTSSRPGDDDGEESMEIDSQDQDQVQHQDQRDQREKRKMCAVKEIFAVEPVWDTDKVRRVLDRVTLKWMTIKISIMAWRHISIAIFRRFVDDKRVNKAVNEGGEDEEEEEDEAFDLQAGHGSKIAGMIYGRQLTESPFHTASRRAGFRKVSQEWHRFLLFRSALAPSSSLLSASSALTGPGAGRMAREAVEEQFRR